MYEIHSIAASDISKYIYSFIFWNNDVWEFLSVTDKTNFKKNEDGEFTSKSWMSLPAVGLYMVFFLNSKFTLLHLSEIS